MRDLDKIGIKDRPDLARDISSKGLVSRDQKGLRDYRDKQNMANRINNLENRIANLESQLAKILGM